MREKWLVGLPVGLSGHYSESENFAVSATRRDIRGNILSPPSGTTKEYGFSMNLFQNRVAARFNWYDTTSENASLSGGTAFGFYGWINGFTKRWWRASQQFGDDAAGFQAAVQASIDQLGPQAGDLKNPNFQSFEDVYEEIFSWLPSDIRSFRNPQFDPETGEITDNANPGETATFDFVSTGFEFELVANITDHWRFFMNLARQEAVQSNTAVDFREASFATFDAIKASPIGLWADSASLNEGQSFESRFLALIGAPLAKIAAQDGKLALELREWRFNAVTTYDFTEGFLKGFSIGGGIRYQSGNAIGYHNICLDGGASCDHEQVIPDLANPFFGPSQTNGDVWVSFRRPFSNGKLHWKIQLNVRNAFGDSDYIPVIINPDGKVAVVRNGQPTEVFVTNTFSF